MSDDQNNHNNQNSVWYIVSLGFLVYIILYYLIDKGLLTVERVLRALPYLIVVSMIIILIICIKIFIRFIRKL